MYSFSFLPRDVLSCVQLFVASWELQPTRIPSPGKNTGVSCHFLLQGIFPIQESKPLSKSPALAGGFFIPLKPPGKPLPIGGVQFQVSGRKQLLIDITNFSSSAAQNDVVQVLLFFFFFLNLPAKGTLGIIKENRMAKQASHTKQSLS